MLSVRSLQKNIPFSFSSNTQQHGKMVTLGLQSMFTCHVAFGDKVVKKGAAQKNRWGQDLFVPNGKLNSFDQDFRLVLLTAKTC